MTTTNTESRLVRYLRATWDFVLDFAPVWALFVVFAVMAAATVAYVDRAEANRERAKAYLSDTYGAEVVAVRELKSPGFTARGVTVKLPTGIASCDVTVAKGTETVALLCGSDKVEPPRR